MNQIISMLNNVPIVTKIFETLQDFDKNDLNNTIPSLINGR